MNFVKTILFCFGSFLISSQLNAQNIFNEEIKWGDATKNKLMESSPDFIGRVGDKILTISSKGSASIIEEYDASSMAPLDKQDLQLKYDGRKLDRENELVFSDKLYLISSFLNKQKKIRYYFVQTYEGAGKLSTPKPIGSMAWERVPGMTVTKKGLVKREQAQAAFKVMISDDESHIAFLYPDQPLREANEKNNWHAKVFDKELSEVWSHSFNVSNNDIYIDKAVLSNDLKIYCSGVEGIEIDKRVYWNRFLSFTSGVFIGSNYHLFIIDGAQSIEKQVEMELKDANLLNYSFNVLNNEIIFYGMTHDGQNKSKTQGIMIKKLDIEGNELFTTFNTFTENVLSYNEETDPKGKQGLFKNKNIQRFFNLKDIVVNDDGDLIFMAEQFYYYITRSYNQTTGQNAETAHYVFGDVLITSCSEEGNLNWMTRVVKYQHSINDFGYYSSYYYIMEGNNLYLLVNDSEYYARYDELKDANLTEKRKAKKNLVLSSIQISSDGKIKRFVVIDEGKGDIHIPAPKTAVKVGSNLIMVGRFSKKVSLAMKVKQNIGVMKLNL